MIEKFFYHVRAAAFSLAVVAGLLASQLVVAPQAVAEQLLPQMPSKVTLAQDLPVFEAGKVKKKVADSDDENGQVRTFVIEKTKWIRELPVLKALREIMQQMWEPIRIAFLLIFLAFFVGFHFRRQQRYRLESEQNRQPSAHEAEFGIVAPQHDAAGKEASP